MITILIYSFILLCSNFFKSLFNFGRRSTLFKLVERIKNLIVKGLRLSEPFQPKVLKGKLFRPEYSSTDKLLEVIGNLDQESISKCFAWGNKEVLRQLTYFYNTITNHCIYVYKSS